MMRRWTIRSDAKDELTDMSRAFTILIGSTLLTAVAWLAVSVHDIPLAPVINDGIAELLDLKGTPANYADAIFTVLCLLVAVGVGCVMGSSWRGSVARVREDDLQRRLNESKGKIPRLESGMRNREMHVARVEQQMKELEAALPPLHRTIEERDTALRDRDRTVSRLTAELALLKGMPSANQTATSGMATLDLEDDTFMTSGASAELVSRPSDSTCQRLEEQVNELEAKVREREARIGELMYEQGNHAKKIPQLESALGDQRKRNEDHDRERQRQDKWLDVLNDQLARARETNDRLGRELSDQAALQRRIAELEAELKRLGEEIAERERRLAASRFECATARTTIAHLQSRLGVKDAANVLSGKA